MDLVTLRTVQFIYLTNKCHSIDSTARAVTSLHCRVRTNHSAAFTHILPEVFENLKFTSRSQA